MPRSQQDANSLRHAMREYHDGQAKVHEQRYNALMKKWEQSGHGEERNKKYAFHVQAESTMLTLYKFCSYRRDSYRELDMAKKEREKRDNPDF